MSEVIFDMANINDIPELIRLRIAYIIDDYGSINEFERQAVEEQLPDYFKRKLGNELILYYSPNKSVAA